MSNLPTASTRPLLAVLALAAALPAHAEQAPVLESQAESGPVSATLRLHPTEPVIGDALVLELEVVAEPGVELLMPEFGEALDRFRIVDFAPGEGLDDQGRSVATQRYTLQPARSGPQNVPPLRIEFVDRRPGRQPAPDGEDAYELLTGRLSFEVKGVLAEGAPLELRAARGALPPLAEPRGPLWPWLLAGGGVLAAAGPFAWRALQRRLARERRRSAYDVARSELDALLYGPAPDAGSMDEFFVRLSGIVRGYLEDRFGVRSPELTTEEFLAALSTSPELVRSHQDLLREFLRTADLVKFARHVPEPEDVEGSIRTARDFLDETREGGGDATPLAGPPRLDAGADAGAARA